MEEKKRMENIKLLTVSSENDIFTEQQRFYIDSSHH